MKHVKYELALDETQGVELFVSFFLGEKSMLIEEFVIILFYCSNNEKFEVIKYDCSFKERFHVHKNYLQNKPKEYLQSKVDSELIISIKEDLKVNWKKYVDLFKQNNYI